MHADQDVAVGVHLEQVAELRVEPEASVGAMARAGQLRNQQSTSMQKEQLWKVHELKTRILSFTELQLCICGRGLNKGSVLSFTHHVKLLAWAQSTDCFLFFFDSIKKTHLPRTAPITDILLMIS